MKQTALFLKVVVFLMGILVFAVCLYGLSRFDPNSPYWALPELAPLQYPILIGMYAAMIPFFTAWYQLLRVLNFIGKGQTFSAAFSNAIGKIKRSALLISLVYLVEMPFLYRLTQVDDTPGIIIGLFVVVSSLAIAVFSAVVQKRMKDSIVLRSERNMKV